MANIIGEQIHEYVAQQINHRQHAHGSGVPGNDRLAEYITYLNSKTAWVKLASGIMITPERIKKEGLNTTLDWATLAKRNILSGGTSRLENGELIQRGTHPTKDNLYDHYDGVYNVNPTTNHDNPEFGLVPMPGIESADIKCMNRGSIKKATVKIKCYSPEQFQTLNLLYLRAGYTMLLEWGNSLYLNNDKDNPKLESMGHTLIEASDGFFSEDKLDNTYSRLLKRIQGYRADKLGNYDALLAKVVNFSWDFLSDDSYDITLELISLGDVIESLKTNITPSNKISSFIKSAYILFNENAGNDTKDINPTPTDNVLSAYLFLQKLYLDQQSGGDNDQRQAVRQISVESNNTKIEIGGQFIKQPNDGILIKDEYETSNFDTPLEARNYVQENYGKYHPLEISTNTIFSNKPGVEFSIWTSAIPGGGYYAQISINLTQKFYEDNNIQPKDILYLNYLNGENDNNINDLGFYMRFGHLLDFIKQNIIPTNEQTNEKQIDIDTGQWNNFMHTFPYQVSLDPRVCIVNSSEKVSSKLYFPELISWKKDGNDYGWLMNIYLNHSMLQNAISSNTDENGNLSLFEFLSSICTELNKALGGINNLEPVIDEEKNIIRIIDHNYQPNKKNKTYGLELYGYNPKFKSSNFVRTFSLKTEITPEFATMATIGSTAGGYVKGTENTMFSKWNKGIIDRYKEKFVAGDETSRDEANKTPEAVEEYITEFFKKSGSSPFGWTVTDIGDWDYGDNTQDINGEIIDNNISVVTEFYKYCK